jgi:hypothetical protein
LLIKKYLAGELDAHAMHELERRALDDPFLADAIEGYGQVRHDQQKNLGDLSARLRVRADKKVRVLTLRMQLSIAASLLVIIGIGAWLVTRNQNAKQAELKQVAVNVPSAPKPGQPALSAPTQPAPQVADTVVKEKATGVNRYRVSAVTPPQADAATSQPPAVAELQVVKPDTNMNIAAAKAPPSSNGYFSTGVNKAAAPQFKSSPGASDAVMRSLNANKTAAKKPRPMVPETLLNAHEENLNVQPAMRGNHSILVGQVTGNDQPIVGAIVKLSGADFGVVTDVNGRFVMHNIPDNKSLEVKSLGYATKQVKLNGRDSIAVLLEPNVSSLAEVTIIEPNNNNDKSSGSAGVHPGAGWKALNTYLDKNAVSPDGKSGKVLLSFTVNGRGGLSGFTVAQSLSPSADQKAIDLISNGPAWAGNIDGQPYVVTVTVSFH